MVRKVHGHLMRYSLTSVLSAFVISVSAFIFSNEAVWMEIENLRTSAKAFVCNYSIPLSMTTADGSSSSFSGVTGGSVVCLEPGSRGSLTIKNFNGNSTKPVMFVNNGGIVKISGSLGVWGNRYIRITGGENSGVYGIEVSGSSGTGVRVAGGTSDFEIDHLRISNASTIGIEAKTDFSDGDRRIADTNGNGSIRDEFTQYNTVIRDNYLHDIGREAVYVGSSEFDTGADPVLRSVRIYNNRIERAGWDGIQVGSAVEGVQIYANSIVDVGSSTDADAGNNKTGMQISPGTTGDIFNNRISNSRRRGIYLTGQGPFRVFNNLIVNVGMTVNEDAIHWSNGSGEIYNNTLVKGSRYGIGVGSGVTSGKLSNNLIVEFAGTGIIKGNTSIDSNLILANQAQAGFVNSSGGDYHLTAVSTAVDAGSSVVFSSSDIDGQARPQGSRVDVGFDEYASGPVPTMPITTPVPSPIVLPTQGPTPPVSVGVRPRVKVNSFGIPVTGDTNAPLRGDNPRLFTVWGWDDPNKADFWNKLRQFKMNTVRVLVYREPQYYSDTACKWSCSTTRPDLYSASDADANGDLELTGSEIDTFKTKVMNRHLDRLRQWVSSASQRGFYVIIDYHPVGGYEEFDAREWWKIVAPEFKNNTNVIYELTNEPVAWEAAKYYWCNDNSLYDVATCADKRTDDRIHDYKHKTPIDAQVALYNRVRALAPNTHLVLWSFANASGDMAGVVGEGKAKGINYNNTSVGIHIYGKSSSSVDSLRNKCLSSGYGCGVWSTEMGGTSTSEYNSKIAFVEGIGIKSWITLDGVNPGKEATVTWSDDPYFTGATLPTSTPAPSTTPVQPTVPVPTIYPTVTVQPTNPVSTSVPTVVPTKIPTPTSVGPTLVPTGVTTTGNLLKEGSFSVSPTTNSNYFSHTNASNPDGVSFVWDSTGYLGRSVRVSASGVTSTTYSRWLSQHNSSRFILVEPGKEYYGEAYLKTQDVTNNANITLVFWGPGTYDYISAKTSSTVTGTTSWTKRTVSAVAPANAKYVRFEMRLMGNGTAWFDEVVLQKR